MSFNLATRLNDLENLTTSSLSSKADRIQPIFISPVAIKDNNDSIISNFDSTSIILNKPVICNSSLSAPISIQQKNMSMIVLQH